MVERQVVVLVVVGSIPISHPNQRRQDYAGLEKNIFYVTSKFTQRSFSEVGLATLYIPSETKSPSSSVDRAAPF